MPSLQLIFNINILNKDLDISSWFKTGEFPNGDEMVKANYDFWIDWGDGKELEHYDLNSDRCPSSDNETITYLGQQKTYDWTEYLSIKHHYDKVGTYRVTIHGICDNLFGYHMVDFGNGMTKKPMKTNAIRNALYGILVPKNKTSPLKYAYASFFGCQNLNFFGKGVLDNLQNCKTLFHLFDGASVNYIYPNIFSGCSNVQYMGYVFEACTFSFIYQNTLKFTPNVTNCEHMFHRCIKIRQIPQGFFDYVPLCQNFNTCFKSCTSLKRVPSNLFDKCPNVTNVKACFCGGAIMGDNAYDEKMYISHIPPLWNTKPNIQNKLYYAHGCTFADNYDIAFSKGWT